MTQVSIHGFAASTYTRTACMAAIEVGVDYELVPLAYGKPEHFALHPFGKMPVLGNGEESVYETLAILAYLDRSFAAGQLFPPDSLVQNLSVISAGIDYAYRPVVHVDKDDEEQLAAATQVFDWLEGLLQRSRYLAGDSLTAADLLLAPMLDYHINAAGSEHLWVHRPRLEAWFKTMGARDSFRKTASQA